MQCQQLSEYFVIDADRLFEQWSVFARDYYNKACELADARAEYERVKRQRDVVEAELDKDIRLNPDQYGVTKITEPVVERTILLQKRHMLAFEEVIRAKHSMDIHQAYMDAMDAMKKGLESTAYLQQSAFYAQPVAKGEAAQQHIKEAELRNLRRLGQTERLQ